MITTRSARGQCVLARAKAPASSTKTHGTGSTTRTQKAHARVPHHAQQPSTRNSRRTRLHERTRKENTTKHTHKFAKKHVHIKPHPHCNARASHHCVAEKGSTSKSLKGTICSAVTCLSNEMKGTTSCQRRTPPQLNPFRNATTIEYQ